MVEEKCIEFSDFSSLWEELRVEGEEKLRKSFIKLDKDFTGFVTKGEMMSVLSSTAATSFTGQEMVEAQNDIERLDVTKDGKVSYNNFTLVIPFPRVTLFWLFF